MSATRPRSLSCPPTTATPPATAGPPTSARKITRRTWLGCVLLGAQVVALAACGGDDEDDAQQPRAAPPHRRLLCRRISRESVVLTLAASRGGGPAFDAIRQWNEGNIPGVPDNVELQDAKLTYSTSGNLKTRQDAVSHCP